jgi:DNA-binding HxlR family transcriptional regulator
MLSYKQYCPVAKTAEIFADRWTPLILRELCSLSRSFGDLLEGMPLIPRTTLSLRLKELADAEVIAMVPKPRGRGYMYRLTPAGEEFRPLIEMMAEWGQRWAFRRIRPEDLDTSALMFAAAKYANEADLPAARTVVRFEFRGIPKARPSPRYWWWIMQRPEIDVCLKNHGFDVDVEVKADLGALTKVYLGHLGLTEALDRKLLAFEGPRAAIVTLCRVMDLHQDPKPKKFSYPSREIDLPAPTDPGAKENRYAASLPHVTFDASSGP